MHLCHSHDLLCAWWNSHTLLLPAGNGLHDVKPVAMVSDDLQVALVISFGIFFIVKRSDAGRIPSSSPLEAKRVSQRG